jgi:hypothetical protein
VTRKPNPAALRREAEQRASLFLAIGEFIFEFSQLEFTIRHALGTALGLNDDSRFDTVTSPYDFAALCRVTSAILQQMCTCAEDAALKAEIASTFRECLALNDERVRIAHGTWTIEGGARHVSRTTLQAKSHFEKPEKIIDKAREASALRTRVVQILIGKPDEWPEIARSHVE